MATAKTELALARSDLHTVEIKHRCAQVEPFSDHTHPGELTTAHTPSHTPQEKISTVST